ncbi:MAG: hypothetical protein R3B09_30860 [Nannocystaceae bacterium]
MEGDDDLGPEGVDVGEKGPPRMGAVAEAEDRADVPVIRFFSRRMMIPSPRQRIASIAQIIVRRSPSSSGFGRALPAPVRLAKKVDSGSTLFRPCSLG